MLHRIGKKTLKQIFQISIKINRILTEIDKRNIGVRKKIE